MMAPAAPDRTDRDVLVAVRGLTKSYRRGPEEVHALRGASFVLRPGESVALMGPSGSGKTTVLNLLCGWEQPDGGEIQWSHDDAVPAGDRPWSDVAVVPQDLGLMEDLSVRENVELPLRLSGRPDQAGRVEALLTGLGLDGYQDRAPHELSLGEQQRAALARALILSPRLLLADEPTGHQDAGWGRAVFTAFRLAAREGTSSLMATHNPEALKFVDRALAMRDGLIHELERRPD
ncbi:MAG TPA: ATP-binding cassette domain-containing protein [Actinomycetota bacterium]|jgi:putative ABC transport system ATP-binding protein